MTKFYIDNIIDVCVSKENSENNIHIAYKIQVFVLEGVMPEVFIQKMATSKQQHKNIINFEKA